ncbi:MULTISPECIES: ABC transporter substrate-binding protein [unclassified Gilliamella]|uniref:ABC transporter substrate-binding protein n=1 Tax=unclassified Gilliamella TaxID=2685620 RepID=UPI00132636EE|nr:MULTISPECIES: ABC transporter substrate-binding protein [unclassified Gilliamella]MWN32179.1 ABC transporter substrate-binding protein [Gilliamella sp. Pra-s60]MWP29499.1 ABC transporter substrate-binding protein [Gilliamella sp. Pra-s54]
MRNSIIKLCMLLSLSLATFCSFAEPKAEQKFVAITAIVEHPALDNVRKGVEDELKDNGYINGQNLKLQFASAQGTSANAAQIAKQFAASKPDVIVGIATPSTQALVATTKNIPIVFTAVTDPVAAKLTSSWEASKTNVTGVSDALPLDSQIEMMLKIKPDAKNIGYVYSPSEVNSTIVLKELRSALEKRGMKIIAAPAQRTSDISTAAQSLKGKVDMIYTTTDNNVVSAYEALAKVANENKIPLLASDPDSAERGAIAALGMSYYDLGRQAGKIVIRILNGENPGDIPPQVGNITQLTINKKAAERQGVTLSEDILKSAAKIVEK